MKRTLVTLAALVTLVAAAPAEAKRLPEPRGYPGGAPNPIKWGSQPAVKAGSGAELAGFRFGSLPSVYKVKAYKVGR